MADQTGIEPAIFSVTGRHVNRYTTGPLVAEVGFEPTNLQVMSLTSYRTALLCDMKLIKKVVISPTL